MKLALGTAQFGIEYGVANKSGQVPPEQVKQILTLAEKKGISILDTAAAYGSSEKVLGDTGIDPFRIVTKIPPYNGASHNFSSWVNDNVLNSLDCLKVNSLYGVLFHRPLELLQKGGIEAYEKLLQFKKDGVVKRIGVSVYSPQELDKLFQEFNFDIVQAPMNIFDRRFLESGWLKKLKNLNVEVHIRSAFLQGLLLLKPEERPPFFNQWEIKFSQFDSWVEQQPFSPLAACISFFNSIDEVDSVVIGIDSFIQLQEVLSVGDLQLDIPSEFRCSDENLINPGNWNL